MTNLVSEQGSVLWCLQDMGAHMDECSKGGNAVTPMFSCVKVRRKSVDVCLESRSSLNVHKIS